MLTLLVGTPGSGKTLYAIDHILKIANNEAPEYKNIEYVYTNISGFKFDKFNDNKVVFDKLVFFEFYEHLKNLFEMYLQNENNDNVDDLLKDYCKHNNLLNAYFIIDEAHNHFDNQDKIKNWWFTYHRHLNHEILLITQNKTLINTQYRNIPEIFIKAQPRSKAISKNTMRYFLYTEYRMTQKFSTIEINTNKTYFDIYTSGNISTQKLQGKTLLILFISILITSIFIFIFLIYKFVFASPEIEVIKNISTQSQDYQVKTPIIKNKEIHEKPIEDIVNKMFKFTCFNSNCYLKMNKKLELIPYDILKIYITNGENIYIEQKSKRLNVFLFLPENTFNFLQGVQNEKTIKKDFAIDNPINPNFDLTR